MIELVKKLVEFVTRSLTDSTTQSPSTSRLIAFGTASLLAVYVLIDAGTRLAWNIAAMVFAACGDAKVVDLFVKIQPGLDPYLVGTAIGTLSVLGGAAYAINKRETTKRIQADADTTP